MSGWAWSRLETGLETAAAAPVGAGWAVLGGTLTAEGARVELGAYSRPAKEVSLFGAAGVLHRWGAGLDPYLAAGVRIDF